MKYLRLKIEFFFLRLNKIQYNKKNELEVNFNFLF